MAPGWEGPATSYVRRRTLAFGARLISDHSPAVYRGGGSSGVWVGVD